jgi:hypothetical protein
MSTTKQTQANTQAMSATESQQVKALEMRVWQLEQLCRQLAAQPPVAEDKPVKKAKKAKTDGPKLNKDGSERKKRAPSGYLMWSNENRADVRAELEAEVSPSKVAPAQVVSALAARWNAMPDEEKQVWKDEAKEMQIPVVEGDGSELEMDDSD